MNANSWKWRPDWLDGHLIALLTFGIGLVAFLYTMFTGLTTAQAALIRSGEVASEELVGRYLGADEALWRG